MIPRFAAGLCCAAAVLSAQSFSQRGFLEFRGFGYPQEARNDPARLIGESLFRWEGALKTKTAWQFNASFDARVDSHRQFDRLLRLDVLDQNTRRPALSLRRLSATYSRAGVTVELGRQFIRWGKADLLNPTDRFAPRDFTNALQPDFLGITAARVTYERGSNTWDLVYVPLFTPSRTPLLDQRWVVTPRELDGVTLRQMNARLPGRGQAGLRWSRVGRGFEYSLSYYDGFYHLPLFDFGIATVPDLQILLTRFYPRLRLYGGDVAVPLRWFTLKSEAGYFQSPDRRADQFLQYVVQAERIAGEWVFVGGYAGEWVKERRSPFDFAPDRGIARTFLGRASYNLDANRTVAAEGAVRQNGAGAYWKGEYTQAIRGHWRATVSYTFLRGRDNDFFGQFRRNGHFLLSLRYSY